MLLRAVRPLLLLFAVLVALPSVPAQAASGGWSAITRELPARQNGVVAEVRPERFRAYALDRASLRSSLAGVPLEGSGDRGRVVGIAGPRGVERFRVVESPV